MGRLTQSARLAVLLLFIFESNIAGVHGAFITGARSYPAQPISVDAPDQQQNSSQPFDSHYRSPLVNLCEKSGTITMNDVRGVAPELFLRLVQDQKWKEVILSPEFDVAKGAGKFVSSMLTDPAFDVQRGCERRIMQDVFPQLFEQLTSHIGTENLNQDIQQLLKKWTTDAIAESVGSPMDAAHSFNKLQDKIIAKDTTDTLSITRVDAVETVKRLVDSTQVLLQHTITTSVSDFDELYGDQPKPPNLGEILQRSKDYASIDYDEFSRQALTVVKINSGLLIFVCYATAAYEFYQLLQRDPDGEFIMREQLRTGKHSVLDTAQVEKNPAVGSSSVVQGSTALDAMLYGANFPLINRVPLPGQADSLQLRITMLKGEDKTLYQTLTPEGRKKFQSLFGHAPADMISEGDIIGRLERPVVTTDRKTGYYSNSVDAVASDDVKQALFGVIGEETNSVVDERAAALMYKDIGGFTGSLRMKVLRLALDARTGNGDLMSRRLKLEAMKTPARLVAVEDIIALLYWIQTGSESDSTTKIRELTDDIMGEIQENVSTVCYYEGGRASDTFQNWVSVLGLVDASGEFGAEGCPKLQKPQNDETSQIFIKIADVSSLPSVQSATSKIDSTIGLTPGQQLKLAQINSATRVDNLYSSISSLARVNFALTVVSYLRETWVTASRLYELSKSGCENRDPDEMTLFWNVPMPAPACPVYGIAYFPEWVDWLANNGGKLQFFASDPVGNKVEYQCQTGIQPDPETRLLHPDNNPTEARLSGHIPSCVQAPKAYTCFYRDTQFDTRNCVAPFTPTGDQLTGDLDHAGWDVLPGTLDWRSVNDLTKTAEFKAMFKFSTTTGETDDGYICAYRAQIDVSSISEFNVYKIGASCGGADEKAGCNSSHKYASGCNAICQSEDHCQSYFTYPVTNEVSYCYTMAAAVFPIAHSTTKESTVCYKDLGVRLTLNDPSTPKAEVRFQRDGFQVYQEGALVSNQKLTSDNFITMDKYRYLHFKLTEVQEDGDFKVSLEVIPMYRHTTEKVPEDNFKWLKGTNKLEIKDLYKVSVNKVGVSSPVITNLGAGCYERGQISDLCYLSSTEADAFIYPSSNFSSIHSSQYIIESKDRGFKYVGPDPTALASAAFHSNVQIAAITEPIQVSPVDKDKEEDNVGKEETIWAKIEHTVWGLDKLDAPKLPTFDFAQTVRDILEGPAKWTGAMNSVQALMNTDSASATLLSSMLQSPPFKVAAHLFGKEGEIEKVVSSLEKPTKQKEDRSLLDLGEEAELMGFVNKSKITDFLHSLTGTSQLLDKAAQFVGQLTAKLKGKPSVSETHISPVDKLGTQTLLQGFTSFPTDPYTITGPVKATGSLLLMYFAGCILAVFYLLLKNKDRLNKTNNLGFRDYEMFNPAIAILPNGGYAQQYGPSAQAQVFALMFVVLASVLGMLRLARFTVVEGAKANDALYGTHDNSQMMAGYAKA